MRSRIGLIVVVLVACAAWSVAAASGPDSVGQGQEPGGHVAVEVDSTPCFVLPDAKRQPLTTFARGTVLTVISAQGDWIQIEFQDPWLGRRVGYVERKRVSDVERKNVRRPTEATRPPVAGEPVDARPSAPPAKTAVQAPQLVPPAKATVQAPEPAPTSPTVRAGDAGGFSMVLARFGYFLAADPSFVDVYHNGVAYGAEVRIGIPRTGRRLVGWAEGNYRARTGSLSYTQETTRVKVTALEAGAIYRIVTGRVSPYVGAGAGYYLFQENNEPLGAARQNKAGFCGVAGAATAIGSRFVVDVKVKYSSVNIQPAEFAVKLGGTTVGFGAGLRF